LQQQAGRRVRREEKTCAIPFYFPQFRPGPLDSKKGQQKAARAWRTRHFGEALSVNLPADAN
jgi:hypothetical protein